MKDNFPSKWGTSYKSVIKNVVLPAPILPMIVVVYLGTILQVIFLRLDLASGDHFAVRLSKIT